MKIFKGIPLSLKVWIVISAVICAFSLLSYANSQQVLRQSANDPQIQMAEDLKTQIDSGKDPKSLVVLKNIDLGSLDPFLIVYDKSLKVMASEAKLDRIPNPPSGVFDFVKKIGYEWFTWQPRGDIRIATVMYYDQKIDGYIVAGRNFRQIEQREQRIFLASVFTFVAAEITTLVASLILL